MKGGVTGRDRKGGRKTNERKERDGWMDGEGTTDRDKRERDIQLQACLCFLISLLSQSREAQTLCSLLTYGFI